MKRRLYWLLAAGGMRKNGRLYLPYLLTGAGMVTMQYILAYLSRDPAVAALEGGATMQFILVLGRVVAAAFALVFLLYTSAFLARRRQAEFGLYNMLGMGKRELARIVRRESLLSAAVSVFVGLLCGVLLSRLFQLLLSRVMGGPAQMRFAVDVSGLLSTVAVFGAIFLLIALRALRSIRRLNPLEMMREESAGEKPPRQNAPLAMLGAALLAAAYALAASVASPLLAILWFFLAVLLVIAATYLLFIAGSVALCRLLQKKPDYYYRKEHFVSVSSMAWRMRRAGAGLASICVLSTMVLVTLSATACLYLGKEASLRNTYPRDVLLRAEKADSLPLRDAVAAALAAQGLSARDPLCFDYLSASGTLEGNAVRFDRRRAENFTLSDELRVVDFVFLSVNEYNAAMGTSLAVGPGEALVFSDDVPIRVQALEIEGCGTLRIAGALPGTGDLRGEGGTSTKTVWLAVSNADALHALQAAQKKTFGTDASPIKTLYAFNLPGDDDAQQAACDALRAHLAPETPSLRLSCAASERAYYYATYGGLFFLGVLLGAMFLCAAALLMYYRQVSEGYEDRARYQILRKVGMTRQEIRKSVDSQVLAVFLSPLLLAGAHLAAAFPFLSKMLALFALTDTPRLLFIMGGCYLAFALVYALMYRATSRAYLAIVGGRR